MKILVAIDFSPHHEKIVEQAKQLAKAFPAKILLLHVTAPEIAIGYLPFEPDPLLGSLPPDPELLNDQLTQRYHQEHNQLLHISQRLQQQGVESTLLLVRGEAAETILEQAVKHEADMIVIGTHGRGMATKLLLGSTSEGVVKGSELPVYLVPIK